MKVVIIEDEIPASRHLQHILSAIGGFEVVAVLETIVETVDWFSVNPAPDVAFMDIHLADGLAFEIFQHAAVSCPVIFTTAYDAYALKAFKVNSVDYLLKPIETKDVQAALNKLRALRAPQDLQAVLQNLLHDMANKPRYKSHFLIPSRGDKLIPLRVGDLACICIESGVVKALTLDGHSYPLEFTLDELGAMLDPGIFFRANRQFILSRAAIKDVDIWFNSRLAVNLCVPVPEKILISKARITEFKNWFGS